MEIGNMKLEILVNAVRGTAVNAVAKMQNMTVDGSRSLY